MSQLLARKNKSAFFLFALLPGPAFACGARRAVRRIVFCRTRQYREGVSGGRSFQKNIPHIPQNQ